MTQLSFDTPAYMQVFQERFSKLNPEQRRAVETIEGPVLVLAGPGTGKTEIIALRIANILKETQLPPGSILCLTFTDAAVAEMKNRLSGIIGPAANSVAVYTFHAFCNEVLNQNPEYFRGVDAESRPASEIEQIELMRALIRTLPAGDPYKPVSNPYLHAKSFLSTIESLKKEGITPEQLLLSAEALAEFASEINESLLNLFAGDVRKHPREEFAALREEIAKAKQTDSPLAVYMLQQLAILLDEEYESDKAWSRKRTEVKNLLKSAYEKHCSPTALAKFRSLQQMYLGYLTQMQERNLYDFNDMISLVRDAFTENEELLLTYQERYQYILIDEYQDTNYSQNKTVALLASYFESPNIFAVGDDDQSIFRFQGASLENVLAFSAQFGEPEVIALTQNYRSQQTILDAATALIANNQNRAVNFFEGNISKNLVAANPERKPALLKHTSFETELEELHGVAAQIETLISRGIEPEHIAVIVNKNRQAETMAGVLASHNIASQLDKGENVLENKFIKDLLRLFTYLAEPLDEALLFQVLSLPLFQLAPRDLVVLWRYSRNNRLPLSDLINSETALREAGVENVQGFSSAAEKLASWIITASSCDARECIEELLHKETQIMQHLLARPDAVKSLISLHRLLLEADELAREQKYMLGDFLRQLNLYEEYGLQINEKTLSNRDNAVILTTAHSSKGHEYDHVFILHAAARVWDSEGAKDRINIPLGLIRAQEVAESLEEKRRLFFVAMTRARHSLHISSAAKTDTGRSQTLSTFVQELPAELLEVIHEKADPVELEKILVRQYASPKSEGLEINFVRQLLQGYRLSPTDFNAYKASPRRFFFEKVLRLPSPPSEHLIFGSAVHDLLQRAILGLRKNNIVPEWEELLPGYTRLIEKSLLPDDKKENLLDTGASRLQKFFEQEKASFGKSSLAEYHVRDQQLTIGGVPVTGKIDRIDFLDEAARKVRIIDYKTGNPANLSGKVTRSKKTGTYVDQLRFYELLLQHSQLGVTVSEGVLVFVDPDQKKNEYLRLAFSFDAEDLENFTAEIKNVYAKIMALDFSDYGDMSEDEWYADFPLPI